MDNDKDIEKIFKGAENVRLNPKRKQEILRSILSDTETNYKETSPKSSWSFFSFSRVFLVPAVLVLVVLVGGGVEVFRATYLKNNVGVDETMTKISIDTATTETNLNSDSAEITQKIAPSMGGGVEDSGNASPLRTFASPAIYDNGGLLTDSLDWRIEGLIDGYDRLGKIEISIVGVNNTGKEISITYNNSCETYFIIDKIDSRSDQMCLQYAPNHIVGKGDAFVQDIVIDLSKFDLAYGTHNILIGNYYYDYATQITLE